MSYQWRTVPEHRVGLGRLYGVVTGKEVLEVAEEFFGDEDWQPGYTLLWDNRDIEKLAIQPSVVPQILSQAMKVSGYLAGARAAAVISNDLRMMGEHLIMMSGLKDSQVRLFTTMDKALEWIEVPEEALGEG